MIARRGPRGTAWNEQVFTSTGRARAGGPVLRQLKSIRKNSSDWRLYRAAFRKRWSIVEIGDYWITFDPKRGYRQVLGAMPYRRPPSTRP